ncbi:hypothetical protein [Halalkalibacter urbisdiaboli]|uniref:hypothetical protein n=1 Tax=Halalkalibacter urbisdiaboli TaxID=1960589 RepID=UPI000B442546|nr:hypothetical protein [Halalkalibacter urbisdiaboli]
MRFRGKKNVDAQMESILAETDNPAILNDVTNTDLDVTSETRKGNPTLSIVESYVVRNSVDGKTWNQIDE